MPLGEVDVKRNGKEIAVISKLLMIHTGLSAAAKLAQEWISVEVIDHSIGIESVKKTVRLLIVEEENKSGGGPLLQRPWGKDN